MIPGRTLQLLTPGEVVILDRSRCLRHRFAPSSCRKCSDACPHEAISWEERGLQRDERACQGCMLCTAVCPSGAFSPGEVSLVVVLRELAAEPQPVLACSLNPESKGHARVPCLGLLAHPELLLSLRLALGKPLVLNLSACADCPNAAMVKPLERACELQAGLAMERGGEIELLRDAAHLDFREKTCSRREMFGLLRRKSQQTAATLIDRLQDSSAGGVYGKKALPFTRSLLLQVMALLPTAQREELAQKLFPQVCFSAECSGCTGCVGVCPTGALVPSEASSPGFVAERCTVCGLCAEFCRTEAIQISPGRFYTQLKGADQCLD